MILVRLIYVCSHVYIYICIYLYVLMCVLFILHYTLIAFVSCVCVCVCVYARNYMCCDV
jgi:hypothetical protein